MAGEQKSISSYMEDLKEGREIVIVTPDSDRDCDSSIFWKDSSGKINSWSRSFGHMCRTDMDDERFASHLSNMQSEGCMLFARGMA